MLLFHYLKDINSSVVLVSPVHFNRLEKAVFSTKSLDRCPKRMFGDRRRMEGNETRSQFTKTIEMNEINLNFVARSAESFRVLTRIAESDSGSIYKSF